MRTLDDDSNLVPLDKETQRWLDRLAEITGDSPAVIVAKMLRDIRRDDEQAHQTKH